MSRAALAAASSAVLCLMGCHNCLDDDRVRIAFEFAKKKYDIGKFDEAKSLYSKTLELCPDFYEGMLGLANACREYGNQLFAAVNELVAQKKTDQAQKLYQQAKENHSQSMAWFQKTMELKPGDERPHYGLGLLFYQRATSPVPYPYPMTDKGRQRERDLAISEFETCIRKVPDSYQARRYLGLLLIAAGRMMEAREHLAAYYEFVQRTYDHVLDTWPGTAEEDRRRKEAALQNLEKEISDVREILIIYRQDLERQKSDLEARKGGLDPEERRELVRVTNELLQVEGIIRRFSMTAAGPAERALRERCNEYLRCFNRGSLPECLAFVTGSPQEEAELRRRLKELIERGTRYERCRFGSIEVSGDVGKVVIACDIVDRSGSRSAAEVTVLWKLVAGQWRISGHS